MIINPELQDRIAERKEQIRKKPVVTQEKQEKQQENTEKQEEVVQTDEERVNDLRIIIVEIKRRLKESIDTIDVRKDLTTEEDRRKIIYSIFNSIESDKDTLENIADAILNDGERDVDVIANSIYKDIVDEIMEISTRLSQKKLARLRQEREGKERLKSQQKKGRSLQNFSAKSVAAK